MLSGTLGTATRTASWCTKSAEEHSLHSDNKRVACGTEGTGLTYKEIRKKKSFEFVLALL